MDTPVLTELQQKKSLSAKKKLKKVTVRNILATPFTNYWPLIKPEDAVALNEVLAENLVALKPPKIKVPWKDIKDIPREKRKDFRLQYDQSNWKLPDKAYRSDAVFGVNETTKLLENRAASSILISSQVDPRFMVKHVLDMAVLQDVPVLIVPDLTNLLKEKTGIASIAISFKISTNVQNYTRIDQKIQEIAADYPPPSDHINYDRRENEIKDTETHLDSPMDTTESQDEELQTKNLYLYRKSKGRVFVPELSKEQPSTTSTGKMDVDSSGFLAFGDSHVSENTYLNLNQKSKQKTKVSYKSLVIKRVTSNKNRDQKKIEFLKRKR